MLLTVHTKGCVLFVGNGWHQQACNLVLPGSKIFPPFRWIDRDEQHQPRLPDLITETTALSWQPCLRVLSYRHFLWPRGYSWKYEGHGGVKHFYCKSLCFLTIVWGEKYSSLVSTDIWNGMKRKLTEFEQTIRLEGSNGVCSEVWHSCYLIMQLWN